MHHSRVLALLNAHHVLVLSGDCRGIGLFSNFTTHEGEGGLRAIAAVTVSGCEWCERPLWEISSSEGFVELQLVVVVGSSSPGVFAASDASRGSACGATTRDYRFGRGVADAEWERTLSGRVDGRIRTTQG